MLLQPALPIVFRDRGIVMSPSLLLSQLITNRVWNRCRSTVHDDSSVTLICMLIFDHYEILGNCSPSFLRTQHFSPKWKVGVNLYVDLWSLWDSWKLFTLISPDPTFFPEWQVGVNVIDMPHDPESRSRVINYFLFALSLTLECLVRQLLNFNTSETNDTAPWRTTSLLATVEVLPVFHSYSILKKLFSLVFHSIDCIVESPLRFVASLSLYSCKFV